MFANCDDHSQCHVHDNRREYFGVKNTILLLKILCHEADLVLLDRSIRSALDLKHSFGTNATLVIWQLGRTKHRMDSRLVQIT